MRSIPYALLCATLHELVHVATRPPTQVAWRRGCCRQGLASVECVSWRMMTIDSSLAAASGGPSPRRSIAFGSSELGDHAASRVTQRRGCNRPEAVDARAPFAITRGGFPNPTHRTYSLPAPLQRLMHCGSTSVCTQHRATHSNPERCDRATMCRAKCRTLLKPVWRGAGGVSSRARPQRRASVRRWRTRPARRRCRCQRTSLNQLYRPPLGDILTTFVDTHKSNQIGCGGAHDQLQRGHSTCADSRR